ncbi:MAG: ClC family H(+)/Cl(-) exchange transporter [Firmicutes bacterium]|nr:ClC family H(+)/Cl(-) exchange transporter [Bacillota bacterium]
MKTKKQHSTFMTLEHWYSFKTKLVGEGILVGAIVGFVVVFFRFLLEKAGVYTLGIYSIVRENMNLFPLLMIGLVIVGLIIGLILKFEPMSSGSGIPQIEGQLMRKFEVSWWKVLLAKFAGGILAIGAGLSLGREGPSVQIGAAIGQGFGKIFKRTKIEEKFLITCGSSAGLAAAFNAPLAGLMFALEELHKHFSAKVLTSAMAAAIVADFISKHFFGMQPAFNLRNVLVLPQSYFVSIIILGIIIGAFGTIFNKVLIKSMKFYGKLKWIPVWARPIIPLLFAGVLGIVLPVVLGGGHNLIETLTHGSIGIKLLLIILLVKFFFTMISYGSGAPGGIFLPLLVLGALVGSLYGNFLHIAFNMDSTLISSFIILAMAGTFAAIIKAPLTGIILILEMTGGISHLLALALVSITALIASDLLKSAPIYETLLDRIINKTDTKSFEGDARTKILIEKAVVIASKVDGKLVKEVEWPAHSLLITIKRCEKEIIPNRETQILSGDLLIVLTDEFHAPDVISKLTKIAEESRFD